eukprot:scaffold43593_cov31-Tisochrysis_lutea.AAC.3
MPLRYSEERKSGGGGSHEWWRTKCGGKRPFGCSGSDELCTILPPPPREPLRLPRETGRRAFISLVRRRREDQ